MVFSAVRLHSCMRPASDRWLGPYGESDAKLPENWTDTKETLLEGMVFNVKYLGMTLVGQPKGEDMASAAIRRIVATARASAKKFRKVTLTVSPKGIVLTDTETTDLIENVSIYRISYCTADKTQDKVFAYVSQSQFNETLECHAFLCQKKKITKARRRGPAVLVRQTTGSQRQQTLSVFLQIQKHTSPSGWRRSSGGPSSLLHSARPHLVVTLLEGDRSSMTLGVKTLKVKCVNERESFAG
ncbi:Low density lipoprotein receptor adapter protein 1 [Larimichthys crocea]|uniref:Uncharacterized protein n=1 Tax=Larimichthys crocea TaxID=215358 RepID=A0ACD3QYI4_LARCR|nr:Low density lipoprotein receptor adapter protein 1 [Larimichthys crocea]